MFSIFFLLTPHISQYQISFQGVFTTKKIMIIYNMRQYIVVMSKLMSLSPRCDCFQKIYRSTGSGRKSASHKSVPEGKKGAKSNSFAVYLFTLRGYTDDGGGVLLRFWTLDLDANI